MKNSIFTVLFVATFNFAFSQKEQPQNIKLENRIFDFANLLLPDHEKHIIHLMDDLEKKVGTKIGLITLERLNGVSIEEYAKSQANLLGISGKKRDGILIVFSLQDRQLRTEVSVGLSKIITDEVSKLINESIMAPQLNARNYSQAFYNGIMAFKERIEANRNLIGK